MDMLWEAINHHAEAGRPFARYVYGRISENYRRVYQESDSWEDKAHLLCDVVSGMSERYLRDLHDELRELRDGRDSER